MWSERKFVIVSVFIVCEICGNVFPLQSIVKTARYFNILTKPFYVYFGNVKWLGRFIEEKTEFLTCNFKLELGLCLLKKFVCLFIST